MSATVFEWLNRVHRYAIVVPESRVVFIRIQKCGQTSIARDILQRRVSGPVLDITRCPEEWESAFFGPFDIKGKYEFHAVVRNPWDRMVSNWAHMTNAGATDLDFPEYVKSRWWESQPYDKWAHHHPCSYWTHYDGEQMVDKIHRFEEFDKAARAVAASVGLELEDIPHLNKTNHKPYQEYYDDETEVLVGALYSDDVANFGYEFEGSYAGRL